MDQSISIQGSPVKPGERVVYPNGGICRVMGVESKQIAGMSLLMLMLQREEDGATVMVPENKVGSIGLRKVATEGAMDVLFEYLTHSSTDPELDWKVRHRDNFEKMAAGGLLDTAEVLKGLHALANIRPLPTREREMYDSARHQLVGEIAASANIPMAVAENNIDYALNPPPGSGREAPKDQPIDLKSLRRTGPKRAASNVDEEYESDEEDEDEDDALGLGLGAVESDESAEEGDEDASGDDEADEERPAAKSAAVKKASKKSAAAKKAPAKKASAKKASAKKAPAKKAPAKKVAKEATTTKTTASKAVPSKSAPKKAVAKKAVAKKTVAKKAVSKKAPAKKGDR